MVQITESKPFLRVGRVFQGDRRWGRNKKEDKRIAFLMEVREPHRGETQSLGRPREHVKMQSPEKAPGDPHLLTA